LQKEPISLCVCIWPECYQNQKSWTDIQRWLQQCGWVCSER